MRRLARLAPLALIAAAPALAQAPARRAQPALGTRTAPVLEVAGLRFRDLDRDGRLGAFEDWRLSADARARDLVARMTLEEKAGAMMHGTARAGGPMGGAGVGTAYDTAANRALIAGAGVNSVITRLGGDPALLATQSNALQEIAERTRLGIPVTISTDPRHHFQYVLGASVSAGQFSQWPEPLGLAATRDTALVRRFGDVARREYRAVGIHMALSPQADLATEPRWSRSNGTFGEDATLAGRLVRAYVEGFQHGRRGVDAEGVATIVKHWVAYGASREGLDGHNYYGRYADVQGDALAYHVRPFLPAFAANVAGVMPTYPILVGATWKGRPIEAVGAAFNRQVLTDMLRDTYGFRGLVITDWAVTNDCNERCRDGAPAGERPGWGDVAMPWGVEALPKRARFVKAVLAGVDQFGGTEEASQLVEAVRAGELAEARLDESARRVMAQKFALGLFENPYVDASAAGRVVGSETMRAQGIEAQRRSLVLLQNTGGLLPLRAAGRAGGALRVYAVGIDTAAVRRRGWDVAATPSAADVAVVRMEAPYETLHPGFVFGAMQHEGDLAFAPGQAAFDEVARLNAIVPTVATVYLDRPAILSALLGNAGAIVANFGVSDDALLEVLAGRGHPGGKLPFALPASMDDVRRQRGDLAHDLARPLFPFGFGRPFPSARPGR